MIIKNLNYKDHLLNSNLFDRPCDANTFGEGCSHSCNCSSVGECNHINGKCFCKPGFHGEFCEQKCKPWFFGQDCKFECSCDKSKTNHCDASTGKCVCKTETIGNATIKWTGVKCESVCPLGFWGKDCHHQCNCKNNSSCGETLS